MQVTKRNGDKEDYDVEKIHNVVQWATQDINGVSFSDIEMNANLSVYDGVSTFDIHHILIKSANDLISTSNPNYQYVAARLLNMQLRKEVWGSSEPTNFVTFVERTVDNGIYDAEFLDRWSEDDLKEFGSYINHGRDELFTYAGLQQLIDKYLVKTEARARSMRPLS